MTNPEPKKQENGTQQSGRVSQKNLIALIVVIALAVCLCVAAVIAVIHTVRNDNPTEPTVDAAALAEAAKNTVALTVGDHQLSAVELNYYYIESINTFCNNYYYYIMQGLININANAPLNQQYFDKEAGTTWADYFLEIAKENIKSTYMLCDMAAEAGFTLPQSEQEYLDSLKTSLEEYATSYKYASVNEYVADIFGYGAEQDSYLAHIERGLLADAYYTHFAESLEYTDAEIREYEADSKHEYNTYTFAVYTLSASKFLTGGTEDSDGKITYTDEQIAASIVAAEAAANTLKGTSFENVELFKEAILGLDINSNLDSVNVKENKDLFYSKIDAAFQEWIIAEERVYGEVAIIPNVTKTGEGENAKEVTQGYYIVWFGGVNDNTMKMKNVRHILLMFKNDDGKTYNDGITSFTDAQKSAALAEAEALLEQWRNGDATEDSFAALATEKTADEGSKGTGGLYENIYPGQMVENFENWCFDETRQYGDTGIVESVYGYHIMFFVSDSELTYRDFMITYAMRTEYLTEWHESLVKSAVLTELCLDYCPMDKTLNG